MSQVWGPKTVVGIFVIAGGLVGADIALWPWEEPIPASIPIFSGALMGFLIGALIAWAIQQVEELNG